MNGAKIARFPGVCAGLMIHRLWITRHTVHSPHTSPRFFTGKLTRHSMVNFATICLSHDRVIPMKLTIIRLQQLSQQDRSDIKKIWPQADVEALAAQLDAQHRLYAARFNDRLLAAVQVGITAQKGRLSQLEVREVTRRRGVGLYLLEETLAQNPEVTQWSMDNDGSAQPEVIAAFMQSAGFTRQKGEWRK